jgi:probable HAF family extracellular repeat protein
MSSTNGAIQIQKFSRSIAIILILMNSVFVLSVSMAWSSVLYSITDLGTLGGTYSNAIRINNFGVIVGMAATNGDLATHAFKWTNAVMTDLGTLGGTYSSAWDINNTEDIIGSSSSVGNTTLNGFKWTNGFMTDLGNFGGTITYMYGLNNAGEATGSATSGAVKWANGVSTILGDANSGALDINDSGEVAGYSNGQPVKWSANGTITDLGSFGGFSAVELSTTQGW